MGGNKRGGGGKKKKKKEHEIKDTLTEVDKEFYELQLSDLNRKITRLQDRCAELETCNTELEENLSKLDEDRSDIIAYLKKALLLKSNELVELQERLDGLKQSMDIGIMKYKEEIAQKNQEYKNVYEELTSEIKLLMGKLNSLEEFRTQKEELMAKFATQEQQIQEQERRHKKELYEYENKFILEKEKLKRQMETRLLQLSIQHQEATDIRIAATTHRMIRENISINNEMSVIQENQKMMTEKYDKMKSSLAKARLEIIVIEEEKRQALKKIQCLIMMIDKLTKEHEKYETKVAEIDEMKTECRDLKEKLKEKANQLEATEDEIKTLTTRLSSGQSHATKLYAEVAALKLNSRRLNATLHKAVHAIKEALRINDEPSEENQALILSKRNALLNNLLHLLNRAAMSEKEQLLPHKIPASYKTGDLGFVPRTG